MFKDMESLPSLDYESWKPTLQTLHRWTQIVGKIKVRKTPWINHSWSSSLLVSPRGLTTGVMHDNERSFSIEFDFVDHALRIVSSDGQTVVEPLLPESVAAFHRRCFSALESFGLKPQISEMPNELPESIPLLRNEEHRSYDPEAVSRFHRTLLFADRVMKEFRARFIGKVSPVHFFWGSFDMAVTRFSGRRAPEHPGGFPNLPDLITRDAYSHEVSSCGFWPGNDKIPYPAFYSYAYPMPWGFDAVELRTQGAHFDPILREYILPYDEVRASADPVATTLQFFQETYEAAANLAEWPREDLEHSPYLDLIWAREPGSNHPPMAG